MKPTVWRCKYAYRNDLNNYNPRDLRIDQSILVTLLLGIGFEWELQQEYICLECSLAKMHQDSVIFYDYDFDFISK